MRFLIRGVTLVELMVTLVFLALLLALGAPTMAGYLRNAKLREGANSVATVLNFARSEAVKRNDAVSVTIGGSAVVVRDAASQVLRRDVLPADVAVQAWSTSDDSSAPEVRFGGAGRTLPFGAAYRIDTTMGGIACGADVRCMRTMVRSGGAIRLCGQLEDC